MRRPRLLLADDHRLVLDGLRTVLEPHFEVIGVVEDGRALLTAASELKPDLILLDISIPLLNGINAAHYLRKSCPKTKLIFVTMHAERAYVAGAFRAGASGYVLKRAAARELVVAIREVLSGRRFITPELGMSETDLRKIARRREPSTPGLTIRQREVLQLIAEGHANKEIAFLMDISIKAVESHKAAISRKLGTGKSADLTRFAVAEGLIGP